MLTGIRNFARADATLEIEPVPLHSVVEEVLDSLAPMVEDRSAEIVVSPGLPTVTGDRGQLVQLLQNLVSNAIKFGPEEAGRVRIGATRGEGAWRIAVTDQGPGIAPHDQERIFEPFRRLRGTGHQPGTGLGLAICKRVAENHGGALTVQTPSDGGAKFVFTLPDRTLVAVPSR
jgi:signal transduction histidine kinase